MKHIFKIIVVLAAISTIWVALLETSTVPRSYTWLWRLDATAFLWLGMGSCSFPLVLKKPYYYKSTTGYCGGKGILIQKGC
ncbi:hypothetical protein ZWY2020_032331 [Hordeum vulgare]|nr:hypothetical protein ZWY2020_032331 [Hordeum vulgare]